MAKAIVILEGMGGPLERAEIDYDAAGDDPDEALSNAAHSAIEGWVLSIGDTIKIREPGREDQ